MSRILILILFLATACTQNWLTGNDSDDSYQEPPPIEPLPDAQLPPPPPQRPALAESYAVVWSIKSVIDVNGEGAVITCPSVYCAPLTQTLELKVSKQGEGMQFVFLKGTASTYVDAAEDLKRSGDVWVTHIVERIDAVGTRHAFDIVQDVSGKFAGSIEWLAKGTMPTNVDDLNVTFDFVATPQ